MWRMRKLVMMMALMMKMKLMIVTKGMIEGDYDSE